MSEARQLLEKFRECESLAIIGHSNPDPDCIASALALERVATEANVDDVKLVYCGEISHQQNRAFINLLNISLSHPATDSSLTSSIRLKPWDSSVGNPASRLPRL
ncbi:bifunctional oligoribonuclease/PAP phosphatase NrnA [Natribaculum luteum]|uniref:Bifunctional oligoribonuclease/PAP phosphatase NrnA n=1 Tax=Natribaculum luteum TaxID=1586232 RepID=A0ABD5P150_9EURY